MEEIAAEIDVAKVLPHCTGEYATVEDVFVFCEMTKTILIDKNLWMSQGTKCFVEEMNLFPQFTSCF